MSEALAPDDAVVDQVPFERLGVEVDRREDLYVLIGRLVGAVGDRTAADEIGVAGRAEQRAHVLRSVGRRFVAQQGLVVVQAVYTVI